MVWPTPADFTDFKKYVRLGLKDGRPHIYIERLLFYPPVRHMALAYMASDWSENGEPLFDGVVGLPNRGYVLAPLLAESSGGLPFITIDKGTKNDPSEFELSTYIKEFVEQAGKPHSGRVSRRHLQIERFLVRELVDYQGRISFPEVASVYAEVPLKDGEPVLSDRHVERITEARKPKVLLIDGFVEDGKKAIATYRVLRELGARVVGLACVVELINWRDETFRGREALRELEIPMRSLVVYEDGEFRNVTSVRAPEFTVPEALPDGEEDA